MSLAIVFLQDERLPNQAFVRLPRRVPLRHSAGAAGNRCVHLVLREGAYLRTHARRPASARTHARTHTYTHSHEHTGTHALTHARTHNLDCASTPTHPHAHARMRTRVQTHRQHPPLCQAASACSLLAFSTVLDSHGMYLTAEARSRDRWRRSRM